MNTWIVIDVPNIVYRGIHATGPLSHEQVPTTAIYALLREIQVLRDRWPGAGLAFCFDRPPLLRTSISPSYKANRKTKTPDEQRVRSELHIQMDALRDKILPELGYANVCSSIGYEADDCIASVVRSNMGEMVIVSSDRDLWQLLTERTSQWNPIKKELLTVVMFWRQWAIAPASWATVKALAGCATDGVVGIKGVGELTAAKYLAGTLNVKTKKYASLVAEDQQKKLDNLPLVRLPFAACPTWFLREDHPSRQAWDAVCTRYGLKSLMSMGSRVKVGGKQCLDTFLE